MERNFGRLSIFLMWLSLAIKFKFHVFKFQRLFQLGTIHLIWLIPFLLRMPLSTSLSKAVLLKFSRSLLSFTLCCAYSEIWRKAPYYDLRHVYKFLYKKNFRREDKRRQKDFALFRFKVRLSSRWYFSGSSKIALFFVVFFVRSDQSFPVCSASFWSQLSTVFVH